MHCKIKANNRFGERSWTFVLLFFVLFFTGQNSLPSRVDLWTFLKTKWIDSDKCIFFFGVCVVSSLNSVNSD